MKRSSQAKMTKLESAKSSRAKVAAKSKPPESTSAIKNASGIHRVHGHSRASRVEKPSAHVGTDKAPWQLALDAFDEAERRLHKKEAALSGFSETTCPYRGETTEVVLDAWDAEHQEFVEDCEVCCQPHSVRVERDRESGQLAVYTEKAS